MANKYVGNYRGIELDANSKNNINACIERKKQFFLDFAHYSNKEDLLGFFQEVFDMIDDDMQNAVFEWNGLDTVIDDTEKAQRLIILNSHICGILGYVFFNVFNIGDNQLKYVTEGFEGAINFNNMLIYGYRELLYKKITCDLNNPAYGADYVFMALIEEELKLHIKRFYGKKYILDLKAKVDNCTVTLDPDEDELYDYLCYNYDIIRERKHNKRIDTISATGKKQYDLLKKYTGIDLLTKIDDLFYGKTSLNQLRMQDYFTDIVDDRFTKLLELLFSNSNLSLRNNLAHGNTSYVNYHNIGYTALLYIICKMISDEHFYK